MCNCNGGPWIVTLANGQQTEYPNRAAAQNVTSLNPGATMRPAPTSKPSLNR